jgi:hypothetical protein
MKYKTEFWSMLVISSVWLANGDGQGIGLELMWFGAAAFLLFATIKTKGSGEAKEAFESATKDWEKKQ